mgnify:CR=1 FL=1
MNSRDLIFEQSDKDSSHIEKISYICGLRARIECEPLSEHSTHSDRVTNIGYLLYVGASPLPFGGFLMLPTMTRPWTGLLAILVNVIVTGLVYAIIAKNKPAEAKTSDDDMEDEEELDLSDIQIF